MKALCESASALICLLACIYIGQFINFDQVDHSGSWIQEFSTKFILAALLESEFRCIGQTLTCSRKAIKQTRSLSQQLNSACQFIAYIRNRRLLQNWLRLMISDKSATGSSVVVLLVVVIWIGVVSVLGDVDEWLGHYHSRAICCGIGNGRVALGNGNRRSQRKGDSGVKSWANVLSWSSSAAIFVKLLGPFKFIQNGQWSLNGIASNLSRRPSFYSFLWPNCGLCRKNTFFWSKTIELSLTIHTQTSEINTIGKLRHQFNGLQTTAKVELLFRQKWLLVAAWLLSDEPRSRPIANWAISSEQAILKIGFAVASSSSAHWSIWGFQFAKKQNEKFKFVRLCLQRQNL